MPLSEQFYGEMETASWVTDAFKNLNKLVGHHKIGPVARPLVFWVIGPKEEQPGDLFLYGHNPDGGSNEKKITSINPKDNRTIMVECGYGRWFCLNYRDSASMMAKKMDMLIHGSYTDIALVSSDVLFETFAQ